MSRLHAWLRILPLILLTGIASALAGGCPTFNLNSSGQGTLQILPADVSVAQGTPVPYVALFTPAGTGVPIAVSNNATWSSSNTNVATIATNSSANGLASTANPGQTTITAVYQGLSVSTSLTVTANTPPPTISSTGVTDGVSGQAYGVTYTCQDGAGGNSCTLRETTGALGVGGCSGLSSSTAGNTLTVGGTPPVAETCPYAIEARDQAGQTTVDQETITVFDLLDIVDSDVQCGVGSACSHALMLTGGNGSYTCSEVGSNGTVSVTPQCSLAANAAAGAGGTVGVVVQATSPTNPPQTTTKTINTYLAEITTPSPLPDAFVGQSYSRTLTLTGFSSVSSGTPGWQIAPAPPGIAIDSQTGALSGTPTMAGTYTFTVTVINNGFSTVTQKVVQLTVQPGLVITPSAASVVVGGQQQFTARAITDLSQPGSGPDVTDLVAWSSSNTGIATISNVAGTEGLATGVAASATPVTITAAAPAPSTATATAALTVTAPAVSPNLAVTGNNFPNAPPRTATQTTFTVSELNGGVATGATVTLTPSANVTITSVSPSKGTCQQPAGPCTVDVNANETVTYSLIVEDPDVFGGTNESVGVVVFHPNDTVAADDSDQLDWAAEALLLLDIAPDDPTVADGVNFQFTATGSYTGGFFLNLTEDAGWNSSNPAVISVSNAAGTKGQATANAAGPAIVTATIGAFSDAVNVTVTSATLTSITVSPDPVPSFADGLTFQLTAMGGFSDGSTQDVTNTATWTTDNPAIATVDPTGLVTGEGVGLAIITAAQGGFSDSVTVDITSAVLTGITITPDPPLNIPDGLTEQFTAMGTFSDGSSSDVTSSVTWDTSDPFIATIDAAGLATGQSSGTVSVTATQGAISDFVVLIIDPAALTDINITPDPAFVTAGLDLQLTATGLFTDGSSQDVTTTALWSSSDTSIATVDAAGLAHGVAAGPADVTAAVGAISDSVNIVVNAAAITDVSVTCTDFAAGPPQVITQTQCLISEVGGADANGVQVNFTSSPNLVFLGATIPGFTCAANACVGDIPANGFVIALVNAEGDDPLGGTFEFVDVDLVLPGDGDASNDSDQADIDLAALLSLEVTPDGTTIVINDVVQFTATGTYDDGSPVDLTDVVVWDSSDDTFVIVSPTGLATGVAAGSANITATIGAFSDLVLVTVNQAATNNLAINVTGAPTGPIILPYPMNVIITSTGQISPNQQVTIQSSSQALVQAIYVISGNITCPTPSFTQGNTVICQFTGDPANPIQFFAVGFADTPSGGTTQSYTFTITPGGGDPSDDTDTQDYLVVPGGAQIIMVPSNFNLVTGDPDFQVLAFAGTIGDPTQYFEVTDFLNWSSANTSVATVDNTTNKGLVHAVTDGTATIQAFEPHNFALGQSFGTFFAVVGVTVQPGYQQSALTDPASNFQCFQTLNNGALHTEVTQDPNTTWSSSNPAVAMVSNAGSVTPVGVGTADIECDNPAGVDDSLFEVNVQQVNQDRVYVTNFNGGVHSFITKSNPDQIIYADTLTDPALVGADSITAFGDRAIVAFTQTQALASLVSDANNGSLNLVDSVIVPILLAAGDVNRQGTCYAAPQFFPGLVQNVAFSPSGQFTLGSQTPLPANESGNRALFNPASDILAVYSDQDTFFFLHDPATCDNIPAGMTTVANRTDFAMGHNGDFLIHLTLNSMFFTGGTIVIQPLQNGLPSGPTFSAPITSPAFSVIGDPTRDGGYVLGFFGTITPFRVDLQNQTVTVGVPFASSSIAAAVVSADGLHLFEATQIPPQRCSRPLDPAGDPLGPPVCTSEPASQSGDGQITVPR